MNNELNIYICLLICGVCCGPISTGYILGYSSPTIRDLSSILSTVQKSTFASVLYIGGIVGSIIVSYIMDKYGRRRSIIYSAIPAILGWLIIILIHYKNLNITANISLFYVARILGGISCGMNMACTTVYLVEISPTSWRGTIASLNQFGITVGIFLSYAFGKYYSYDKSAMIAFLFAVALLIAGWIIPESPRWLLNKDMLMVAKNSLKKLRSKNHDIEQEIRELTACVGHDSIKSQVEPISLTAMLNVKYRSKTMIIIQLMVLQQFTGINAFISYADILFILLVRNSFFIANLPMAIGLVQIIFTLIATLFMDKYGRKSFLKVAGSVMAISMVLLAISFKMELEALILWSTTLYIAGFSIGWGPIPVISSTEMLPQEARSSAGSIAVMTSWIGGYLVTSSFPLLNFLFGETFVFLLFGLICMVGVFFVEKKLPETKGLSLENMIV